MNVCKRVSEFERFLSLRTVNGSQQLHPIDGTKLELPTTQENHSDYLQAYQQSRLLVSRNPSSCFRSPCAYILGNHISVGYWRSLDVFIVIVPQMKLQYE